jgi:hypothetical protein
MKKLIIFLFVPLSISLQAQYSREQAVDILIDEVVGQDSLQFHHLFSKKVIMFEGDTLWGDGYFSYQICIYPENWVFFVDDAPLANWAHPCRYIFFDQQTGAYTIIEDNWPPLNYLDEPDLFFADWDWILGTGTEISEKDENEFLIYPNPVHEKLVIIPIRSLLRGDKGGCQLTLTDITGNQALEIEIANPGEKVSLDLRVLKKGIYILTITQNGVTIQSQKILKQ